MVQTDAWDKRGQKGLFISVGDEPLHSKMDVTGLKKIFGRQFDKVVEGLEYGGNITAKQVFEAASKKWNFHHIQMGATNDSFHTASWSMLGEGYHVVGREDSILPTVIKIVEAHMKSASGAPLGLGDEGGPLDRPDGGRPQPPAIIGEGDVPDKFPPHVPVHHIPDPV